uniref:Uncharacterized protein n=1 Tax=Glossina morsitans morsitans TaxID=37546 RepID=A0A1B0G4K8_GLOMM
MTPENIMKSKFVAALKIVSEIDLSSNEREDQFDFDALKNEFTKACPDFGADLTETSKSQALTFAGYIIYELRHLIKSAKQSGANVVRTFLFSDNAKVLVVLGRGTTSLGTKQPKFENNQLLLTTEQASLLALTVLSKLALISTESGNMILTPLAGAVFSRRDIEQIALETKQDKASVLISVIQSCQNGGQKLESSDASIALVASLSENILTKQNFGFMREILLIFEEVKRSRYSGTNSDTAEVNSAGSMSTNAAAQDAKEYPSVVDATNKAD